MKIAILTHNLNIHSQKRFLETGHALGHKIIYIHLSHCYMNISENQPVVYYPNVSKLEALDAIIPRIQPIHTFYGAAVLRQFERMKIFSINSSQAITWSRDKIRSLQHLALTQVPMPITGIADSPQESEKLIELVGGAPLIVRLLDGTQGKGTVFAETHQAALSVINAFKQLKANILVQEYIKEAKGQDIRCVVVGNEVVAAIQRTFERSSQHANAELPHLNQKINLSEEEKKIACQAAKSLKLNLATVDLIRSKRGTLLLDVDASPHIEALEKITQKDIVSPILRFIQDNAHSFGENK